MTTFREAQILANAATLAEKAKAKQVKSARKVKSPKVGAKTNKKK